MNKYEILQQDMITAMKNKHDIELSVLRSAIAAIRKTAIDRGSKDNINEELVNEVLLKEKKILQEQIDTCPEDREELKSLYLTKLYYLDKYVPRPLDNPEEIRAIIIGELAAAGIESVKANKGKVMKTIMPILKGKADMKVVNQVISEELV